MDQHELFPSQRSDELQQTFNDHDIKVAAVAGNDNLFLQEDSRQHVGNGAARKRQPEEMTELEQRVRL